MGGGGGGGKNPLAIIGAIAVIAFAAWAAPALTAALFGVNVAAVNKAVRMNQTTIGNVLRSRHVQSVWLSIVLIATVVDFVASLLPTAVRVCKRKLIVALRLKRTVRLRFHSTRRTSGRTNAHTEHG